MSQPIDQILVPLQESQRLLYDPTPANIHRCTLLMSGVAEKIRDLIEHPDGVSREEAVAMAEGTAAIGRLLESAAAFRAAAYRAAAGMEA